MRDDRNQFFLQTSEDTKKKSWRAQFHYQNCLRFYDIKTIRRPVPFRRSNMNFVTLLDFRIRRERTDVRNGPGAVSAKAYAPSELFPRGANVPKSVSRARETASNVQAGRIRERGTAAIKTLPPRDSLFGFHAPAIASNLRTNCIRNSSPTLRAPRNYRCLYPVRIRGRISKIVPPNLSKLLE